MLELEPIELPVGELELKFLGLAGINRCTRCELTDTSPMLHTSYAIDGEREKMLFILGRGLLSLACF